MTDNDGDLGHDAFYLDATAREFDWQITWEQGRRVRISKGAWTVLALFDPGGTFRSARFIGPDARATKPTMRQTVDVLEHWGSR